MFRKLCSFLAFGLLASQPASALTILDSRFEVISEFPAPPGFGDRLGDLLFTPDGSRLMIIDRPGTPDAAVWIGDVHRAASGDVVGFGTFSRLFARPGIESGLQYLPGTDTLLFRTLDSGSRLTQRLADGTIVEERVRAYIPIGGLAIIPEPYLFAGDLVAAAYAPGSLYRHPLLGIDAGRASWDPPQVFADLRDPIGESYLGDIVFPTSGPLAGQLLIARWFNSADADLYLYPLDLVTGLPANVQAPALVPFARGGDNQTWGLAIDPVTEHIWVLDWQVGGSDLYQIGEVARGVAPATPIPVLHPSGLLLLAGLMLLIAGTRLLRTD